MKAAGTAAPEKMPSANKTGQIIYELKFKPHEMYLDTASKASQLITRLDRLERILGTSNQENLVRTRENVLLLYCAII